MASAKIVVTGDKRIDRKLRDLGARGANAVVRKAMRDAMKPLAAAVKVEEPVGETGHLHERVKLRAGRRSRNKITVVVALDDKDFDRYYAAFVELGTHRMEAGHDMLRAFDEHSSAVKADAIRRILGGILRAASSGSSSSGGGSSGRPRTTLGRDAATGRFVSLPD